MTVSVTVDERATGTPADVVPCEPRCLSDIGEGAVAVIAIQDALSPVRDEQVVVSAVAVVPDADGRRPAAAHQSCLFRYVGEGTVSIVPVQAVCGTLRDPLESPTVEDEDVEPSVPVIIDEGRAATDRL